MESSKFSCFFSWLICLLQDSSASSKPTGERSGCIAGSMGCKCQQSEAANLGLQRCSAVKESQTDFVSCVIHV